jgi:CRP/FNR family transcriptional regulator, cyclic AMP receptor protein
VADKQAVGLLSQVPLFSECTKKELREIADIAKEITQKQGTVMARAGDRGVGFFLITDGTAKVVIAGKTRRRLGAGEFFGEISLLDGGPRSADVVAETDVTMLGITAWAFRQIIAKNPSIAQKLLRVMAERLRASTKDVTA